MKRIALLSGLLLFAAGPAFAVGETKGLGNVFGPSNGAATLYASTDGAKYGLRCDGSTDTWKGLQAFLTAGAGKSVKLDNVSPCVVTGVSRTFVQSSTYIDGLGGAGLSFTNPSATYLTVSGTQYVYVKNLRIRGAVTGMTRTAWGGLAAYNSRNVYFDENHISGVNGAGILIQNTRDSWVTNNHISNTLSDIIHVTTGEATTAQTNCRNVHVTGNYGYKSGDDTFAAVSYLGNGNTPCENIIMTDNISVSSSQAGFTNAGSRNVKMTGLVKDAQGLNAVRVEEDLSYLTFKPENTELGVMVENPSSTGVLIGRNAANTTGWVDVSGTGLRHRVFIGGNASTNPATNTSLKVNAYGGNGPCVEINGASGVDLTGTVERCGQHGVVATGTTSDIFTDMKVINVGQNSPSTYYGLFYANTIWGTARGRCIDNQGVATTLGCITLSDTRYVNTDYVGQISNTFPNISFIGTPSNTLMQDNLLRTVTTVYDPPSLVMGSYASTTVTVAGAAAGDYAYATFSNSLQGMDLEAEVLSNDTVTLNFINPLLVTRDLASGTVRVFVRKRP